MTLTCLDCGKEVVRTGPAQKRCPKCGSTRAKIRKKALESRRRATPEGKEKQRLSSKRYNLSEKGKTMRIQQDSQRKKAKRHTLLRYRFNQLKFRLSKEGVPFTDLLWDFEWYRTKLGSICHYCGGDLDKSGIGLDRKDNDLPHGFSNVVPCCGACNSAKGVRFSYDEMMLLVPTLRKIREQRVKK